MVLDITTPDEYESVKEYIAAAKAKSELDRTSSKEKTGAFTGAYAINPINNKKIPIWISDYVLASYGTGAVMAVPSHDERDYEFATKFGLDIIKVIECDNLPYTEDGKHINSSYADGLNIEDAKKVITKKLIEQNQGYEKVNYKLRDWVFSRQR